jgi:hypothetical protein
MAGEKQLFSPMPLRAMAEDLSGLELRVLMCVAAHDRLSLATGKGQGCRASNIRMAEMIGCNFSRLCSTLTGLRDRGYLRQEKLGRHTVYRVIYTEADRLLFSNITRRNPLLDRLPNGGVTGCQHTSENDENQPENGSQYIPLNGGIDSEESGENSSAEAARFAARVLPKMEFADNAGAQMARLERALSVGQVVDRFAWLQYLEDQIGDENPSNSGRASRLCERVIEGMSEDEYAQWGLTHGWVDDEGKWHCPHPREAEA